MAKSTLTAQDGRLYLGDYRYSCGEPIDVFVGGKWLKGRIEYRTHGDYHGWYMDTNGNGWCPLVAGMTARRVAG